MRLTLMVYEDVEAVGAEDSEMVCDLLKGFRFVCI